MNAFAQSMSLLLTAAFAELSTPGEFQALAARLKDPLLWPAMKTGAWLVAGSLSIHLVSTHFGLAPSKLAPDFSRLNGLPRLAQLPKQNVAQALQSLLALPVFAYLIAHLVARNTAAFHRLPGTGIQAAVTRVASALGEVLWDGAALLLVLGLIDYYRQHAPTRFSSAV